MENIWRIIGPAIPETLYMTGVASLLAMLIGLPLGIVLTLTRSDGLSPNKAVYTVLDWIVNILRSLPFVILMFLIVPLTVLIVGKRIGTTAAIVPLTASAFPFVARLMEGYLVDVDKGVIEAAQAMGSTKMQLVFRVMIPEALPSIITGITITVVNIISYSAMAGLVGGGGLGDVANRYGYQRRQDLVMICAVVVIIAIVQIVQIFGNTFSKKLNKK